MRVTQAYYGEEGVLSILRNLWGSVIAYTPVIITTISLGIVFKIFYNIFFHPLAAYPGPLLSRTTDFVYWYHWLRGRLPFYIKSIHQVYGTKVRIGPNRISFVDPTAWRDLHGHKMHGKTLAVVKDPVFYIDSPFLKEHSLLSEPNDEKHSKLRRIFSYGFSDRALKAQEALIRSYSDKLVSNIRRESEANRSIDIVKYLNCTTFDIIGELAFGESLGLLANSELNSWVESILYGLESAAIYALATEYPILGYVIQMFVTKEQKMASAQNAAYSEQRVRKRMAKGDVTETPDFWTLVLGQHEKGILNFEQMKSNADLFMAAGSETTATMLSGLMYNWLMNPESLKKAITEVRSSFLDESELTIENIQGLSYLNACFEESMRIYPSTPVGPPRVVTNAGTVCNAHLPVGTIASIAILAANHSHTNFRDPLEFVPERWLPDSPDFATRFANDQRQAFQPFSHGPRNCIGKNLALHEMRLIACKLLWNFNFELCEESRGSWFNQKCFWALWSKPPLWIKANPVTRQ